MGPVVLLYLRALAFSDRLSCRRYLARTHGPTWRCAIVEEVIQLDGTSPSLYQRAMSFFDHEQSATMAPDRATLSVTRT